MSEHQPTQNTPISLHNLPARLPEEISPQSPRSTYIEPPPESFAMVRDDASCEQAAKQTIFQQNDQNKCLQVVRDLHESLANAIRETHRPLFQMVDPLHDQLQHWNGELERVITDADNIRRENGFSFSYKWDTSNISFLLILFLLFAAIQSMVFGVIGVQNTLVTNVVAFMDSPTRALIWSMIFVVFPFIYKGCYASETDERKKERFLKFFLVLFSVNLGLFLFLFAYQYAPEPSSSTLSLGLGSEQAEQSTFASMIPVMGLFTQLLLELTGSVLTLIYYQKLEEKYRKKRQVRNDQNSPTLQAKTREIHQIQQLIFVLKRDLGSIESMSVQFEHEKKTLVNQAENAFFYYLRAL